MASVDGLFERIEKTETCWLWTSYVNPNGYGWYGNHLAHRVAWELLRGSIPDGLQIDHLCKVRHCVNPDHLEPVTPSVNIRRSTNLAAQRAKRTHCPQGHPYSGPNLLITRRNERKCRTCDRARCRDYQRRRRAVMQGVRT